LLSTATGAGLLAAGLPSVHAAGGDTLKIGLIGCGGRGTGAAAQALNADPNVKLHALGDAFPDQCQKTLTNLQRDGFAKKIDVTPERCFSGFGAYKQVIDCCDVVLLTSPPHFRPAHLEAAIDAGRHIFAEKPMAVDAPGARRVVAACRKAREKNLAIVAGFCWRYHEPKREFFKRVHDGAIGDIVALHSTYNAHGLWNKPRQPNWSDMEWQVRNWLYFTWLSGDHIVEQAVHSIDKMAWAMKDVPPLQASGTGGRQVRTGKEYGNIFDHHAVVYEWANGVKGFHFCRQQNDAQSEVTDYILGTQGTASIPEQYRQHEITGKAPWKLSAKAAKEARDMYQQEHDELFASIRSGRPINDSERMVNSTMLAILGRMVTYTGQTITWEQALNSKEDLTPARYEWGEIAVPPVALPGVTKFI
jgi:predicted dehydrogenase